MSNLVNFNIIIHNVSPNFSVALSVPRAQFVWSTQTREISSENSQGCWTVIPAHLGVLLTQSDLRIGSSSCIIRYHSSILLDAQPLYSQP